MVHLAPQPPPPPHSLVLSPSSRCKIQSCPSSSPCSAVNSLLKKRSREGWCFFGSPQHFVPLRFRSPPLYFSSAGTQFLPPQSPVIKPVQNRSLTYTYFLGSVLVFFLFSTEIFYFLFFLYIYPGQNLPNVLVKVRKAVLFSKF